MTNCNNTVKYTTTVKSGRDFIVKFFRILQTLKFLKKSQIFSRIAYILRRKFLISSFNKDLILRAKEETEKLKRLEYSDIAFNLLNKSITFSPESIKWKSKDYNKNEVPERLWLYNLNYFSWLSDSSIHNISKQIAVLSWIIQNPTSLSEVWEPYPTSLRIINLSKWLKDTSLDDSIVSIIYESIEIQILRLFKDLEYHNLGNHLLANLCSIIITYGILHDKIKIDKKIYRNVIDELKNQLKMQILEDGAHIERCPSYHLEMLQMLIQVKEQLINLNEENVANICNTYIERMQNWIRYAIHPNNTLAMFGDTTQINQKYTDYNLKNNAIYLKQSGYFIYKTSDVYFIMKLSGPAPDYNPGHSHCDLLSYELSLEDEKIITDTGVGSYQNEAIRQHCRTSYSHNIPMIEHTEQSDIYSLFRIGRRAKLIGAEYDQINKVLLVSAKDYRNQIFKRKIRFGEDYISVHDSIENRKVTGTFISIVHKFTDEQIKNHKIEVSTPNHRITNQNHLIYTEFGKAQEIEKIVISNKEESEITYAIRWKKA